MIRDDRSRGRHGASRRRWPMRSVSILLSVVAVVLVGCGGPAGPSAPSGQLSIDIPTNPITSGTSVQATASTRTGSGNPTPAPDVKWASANPAIAAITSDGLITGNLKGTSAITATSGSLTAQMQVTVVPGVPAVVTIYAGNGQSGPGGSRLPDPLCTNVKDAAGNQILGVAVSYSVATGGGTLEAPTNPVTGADGIAISGVWTLGATVGPQTVMASV